MLSKISKIIQDNYGVDYFFINSYHLNSNYLKKFETPFDTNLELNSMMKISKFNKNKKVKFWKYQSRSFMGFFNGYLFKYF